MLYGDGGEWALYRGGERAGAVVRFSGDIVTDGARAASETDATAFARLLQWCVSHEAFSTSCQILMTE